MADARPKASAPQCTAGTGSSTLLKQQMLRRVLVELGKAFDIELMRTLPHDRNAVKPE